MQQPPKSLNFFCRDCDTIFVAQPDGTGYEQAPCPTCERLCLTVEFEREEQERNRTEAAIFGTLAGFFLPRVAGWFVRSGTQDSGNGGLPDETSDKSTAANDSVDRVMVATFSDPADAERCWNLLMQEGIEARAVELRDSNSLVPNVNVPLALQVEASDVVRARELVEQHEASPQEPAMAGTVDVSEAVFACEECGETITVPGERRGYVEVCPHCGQYVDVPE